MRFLLRNTKGLKNVGAFVVCLLVLNASTAASDETVRFDRLERGYCARSTQRIMRAIRSQRELRNSLRSSSARVPKVDFTKSMLILISMGRRPSSGYQTRITKLIETSETLRVEILEMVPGRSCEVADIETYPCDLVLTKRLDKPLVFQTNQQTKDCQ